MPRGRGPATMPMTVRISATDWVAGRHHRRRRRRDRPGVRGAGADAIDVSSGQVTPDERPAFGRIYQTPFADAIRNGVGIRDDRRRRHLLLRRRQLDPARRPRRPLRRSAAPTSTTRTGRCTPRPSRTTRPRRGVADAVAGRGAAGRRPAAPTDRSRGCSSSARARPGRGTAAGAHPADPGSPRPRRRRALRDTGLRRRCTPDRDRHPLAVCRPARTAPTAHWGAGPGGRHTALGRRAHSTQRVAEGYQDVWWGRPSAKPAVLCRPTTARSWNSSRVRAPA